MDIIYAINIYFRKKLNKIMHLVTTHKKFCNQNYNRTCSMMAPQSSNCHLIKENFSGLRELKIP